MVCWKNRKQRKINNRKMNGLDRFFIVQVFSEGLNDLVFVVDYQESHTHRDELHEVGSELVCTHSLIQIVFDRSR